MDFLIGRDGDFDQLASSAIIRAKKNIFDANSSHIWVLPYAKAEYINNCEDYDEYYDAVEICERSAECYPKTAITVRNQYTVDRSDLCVFYVKHNYGGAWNAVKYAEKLEKNKILLE